MLTGTVKVHMLVRRLILDADHSFGPEHFHPLIVSVGGFPAIIYCSKSAAFKGERYDRRVPIPYLFKYRIDQNICFRIDLFNLGCHEKTSSIKIMNSHVQENSA